ncbi:FAD-dependent oxidoreductase [Sporomusa acidovorans]|uniref:Electron-transferring-flavoprotein dehydrogenase n=1 Tax=Sporomusa acidovorans (strain ATCC 49682 / DSM 3132 / Mol) TaxID=1123286 RepID=A0ABZ3J9V8_SPOA4|nr:FAD-dependent oxidoreductase [Sporomusa acidovorans]OZC21708.1 electron transfer flavoprotein-ubiquinone oxidoreductase [Sporomusa acidovorans DSM 3132]SDD59484.1 electron transfer flavoprotein-quinone oxidoreductase [Sporomusa acidovorans]
MSSDEKFDAIIIGAGPAGTACAYVLAKNGKSVLLVERGTSAGSKNVTGGRLYTYALELVEPGLYQEAPFERKVVKEQIMMLGANGAMTMEYVDYDFGEKVPQSYSVLRAPFDEWFAGQAEAQGAMLAPGILVDELIETDGKVVGVKAGDDEIYATVVIAADGVNSFIAQKAGLRDDIAAQNVGVGAKEVIELPEKVIEDRFNLNGNEGAARVLIGCGDGVLGGGFLYTNKSSVSLGVVLNPADLASHGKSIHEIVQELKMHPAIYPLVKDGTTIEYGAHLVPEVGYHAMPKTLFKDGLILVGDAAGMVVNTGTIIRGIDLAIVSGVAAARAIMKNENVSNVGPAYVKELQDLDLLPTMKLYANFHELMSNRRMVSVYPAMANEMMKVLFAVDGKLPERMDKAMLKVLKKHVTFGQLLADGWRGFKAI